MREILFRAKEISTGKWIEGLYMKHLKRTPCPIGDEIDPSDYQYLILYSGFSDWNMPKPIDCVEIDPNTVGQFTGLLDFKGNRIFEGDILKWKSIDTDGSLLEQQDTVFYDNGKFMASRDDDSLFDYLKFDFDKIEIIGNIHEQVTEDAK